MTHSTHLRLYGARRMAKDHSNSVGGNPLSTIGIPLLDSTTGSFVGIVPQTVQHMPRR